jgi:predicted nucleic acid-binding Zn ribbon protein
MDDEQYYLNQIPAPRNSRLHVKTIGNAIRRVLTSRGISSEQSSAITEEQWSLAVGPELVRETRVGNLQRGVLLVIVRDSLVSQEIHFRKRQIIERLREHAGMKTLKDLKLRVERF